jgi:hypothetical protein
MLLLFESKRQSGLHTHFGSSWFGASKRLRVLPTGAELTRQASAKVVLDPATGSGALNAILLLKKDFAANP